MGKIKKKKNTYHDYKLRKSILKELPLTAKEYEQEIKKIVKRLGI